MCVCLHTFMYVFAHIHVCENVCTCSCVYVSVCTCSCCAHIHVCEYTHPCVRTHSCMCECTCSCVCVHTCWYVYTCEWRPSISIFLSKCLVSPKCLQQASPWKAQGHLGKGGGKTVWAGGWGKCWEVLSSVSDTALALMNSRQPQLLAQDLHEIKPVKIPWMGEGLRELCSLAEETLGLELLRVPFPQGCDPWQDDYTPVNFQTFIHISTA